jgi:pimeloyl-ACP methyl ester carboxylesterase
MDVQDAGKCTGRGGRSAGAARRIALVLGLAAAGFATSAEDASAQAPAGATAEAPDVGPRPSGTWQALDDMEMYYEVAGEGPPLLLLHWFGACSKVWDSHREALARHYRLIIPDLRAHGRSRSPSPAFTHRQAARDVHALLDSLGLGRVRAIGLSSGGMTLLHVASQRPERLEAMILVGATSRFGPEARAAMGRSVPDSLSAEEMAEWGECSVRGEAQTREILAEFHAMKDSYDDMAFSSEDLAEVPTRTLIVHGDRDEYFPVDIPAEMHRAMPRSSLWIIPGGGHIPIFGARAERFLVEALGFLQPN